MMTRGIHHDAGPRVERKHNRRLTVRPVRLVPILGPVSTAGKKSRRVRRHMWTEVEA